MIDVAAGVVGGLVAGAGGALVPRLIAAVPEPDPVADVAPDPATESEESEESVPARVKVPYAEIAARPELAVRTALASLVAGAVVGAALGWTWSLLVLVPLVPVLVALAVVDWNTHLLPVRIVWPTTIAVALGLVVVWALTGDLDDLVRAAGGFAVAYGSFYLLWLVYPRGLGFGDVRLAGVLGLALGHLGWGQLVVGLYAGFALGGLGGGLLAALKVVRRQAFPFGPFMVLGALVGLVWGEQALRAVVRT